MKTLVCLTLFIGFMSSATEAVYIMTNNGYCLNYIGGRSGPATLGSTPYLSICNPQPMLRQNSWNGLPNLNQADAQICVNGNPTLCLSVWKSVVILATSNPNDPAQLWTKNANNQIINNSLGPNTCLTATSLFLGVVSMSGCNIQNPQQNWF